MTINTRTLQQHDTQEMRITIRERIFRLLLLFLVVVAGHQLYLIMDSFYNRPIGRVVVQGEFRYLDRGAIESAVTLYEGDGFVDVDLGHMVQQLKQNPWVYEASAKRQWPDTIVFNIVEQQPIAAWNKQFLLNQQGEIFDAQGRYKGSELPALGGQEGTEKLVMDTYRTLSEMLGHIGFQLTGIYLDEFSNWQIMLNTGLMVNLGNEDPVLQNLRFIKIYNRYLNDHVPEALAVDMRYKKGAAIAWKPMPVVPQVQPVIEES